MGVIALVTRARALSAKDETALSTRSRGMKPLPA